MATVPYSPVPQVGASGQGLPQVSSGAPEAAFGGEVARAISGLGKTVEGVGDQLFERALWLQNLNNQAEARKADADYIVRSGQLTAEFNSLEGDQAKKAYPTYVQKLTALRESVKGSLTTRMSQEMFDGQTRTTLARSVFSASQHVAQAQKKFTIEAMEAQRTAIREDAAQYPFDDVATERAVRRTRQSVQEEGRLRGQPPEATANAERAYTSAIYASKIEAAAKENPLQAPTMLAGMRDKLTEKDFKRAETVVNNQRDAYGSAKISTDLIAAHTDADGDLTVSMKELQAKARDLARKFSPDDPAFEHKTVNQLNSVFNQTKYAKKQENYDNRDIVNSAILGGASSMDMLLSDPKAAAAYYALPSKERLLVPGRIDGYIKSRDRQWNERSLTTIMGLRANNVEEFLNINPTDEQYKLSEPQIRQVQAEQAKIKKHTGNDPRVGKYMTVFRDNFASSLESLGVYNRTQRNKEDYDHLTGAVQLSIDLWKERTGKPPSEQEFKEKIAPGLIRQQAQSWTDFFDTDDSWRRLWPWKGTVFQHDTGSKSYRSFSTQVRQDMATRGMPEPSDEELYKAYTREQLKKLYPTKSSSGGIGSK